MLLYFLNGLSAWLAQLVQLRPFRSTFTHAYRRSGVNPRSRKPRISIPPRRDGWNEQQLVCRWVTAAADYGVRTRSRIRRSRVAYATSGTHYTARGSLTARAGALKVTPIGHERRSSLTSRLDLIAVKYLRFGFTCCLRLGRHCSLHLRRQTNVFAEMQ